MQNLWALDLPLGPLLETTIRHCVESGAAFCVVDQRVSRRTRETQLQLLGATLVIDSSGQHVRREGQLVDDGIGLVMLTSGSSGVPKAAELTWDALRASATRTQQTLRGSSAPVWLPCLPANHIGGLAVLLRAVLSDASMIWLEGDIDAGPSAGATHVALVRTQLLRHDVSGYYRVLLGGARPPEALPDNVVTTWGMTETGSGIVYDGVALPDVEVSEREGELLVRSPTLFRSYRGQASRPRVVGPDARDDWFPTGDAGSVIDGRVHVRGRLDFVITTGGEKVWPEDVEAILLSLEGVLDAAVVGVDDAEWGQRVVALVVSDGRRLDESIRATLSERVGPWAVPKEIRHVAAIARTPNGKVRRSELAHLH